MRIVLERCDIAPATHAVAIDGRAVVEAFPSSFLGVLIDDPRSLNARRGNRSDVFFRHLAANGALEALIAHQLPGRRLALDPQGLTDHDDRAAFVCALTALCVAALDYTAVGDDDGWIILPARALVKPWAMRLLAENASEERTAGLHCQCADPTGAASS